MTIGPSAGVSGSGGMSALERYRALMGPSAATAPGAAQPTRMQGRNLVFGAGDSLMISVPQLDTDMIDLTPHDPLDLNDKTSYSMQVRGAEFMLTDSQLSTFLSSEIGDTVRDFRVQFRDNNQVSAEGRLTGLRIPFKVEARVKTNEYGQIGIEVQDAKILGIPVGWLLRRQSTQLGRFVTLEDTPNRNGFALRGNTFWVDLMRLVDTPKLEGQVSGVRTQNGFISVYMGNVNPARPLWLPHDGNYVTFTGGTITSDGMTVGNPEILLRDKTPWDPFDIDNADARLTQVIHGNVTMPEGQLGQTLNSAVGNSGDFSIERFDMTTRGGRINGMFKGLIPIEIYLRFGRNQQGELTIEPHSGKAGFIPIPDGILRSVLKGVLDGARQEGDTFVIPSEMLGSTQLGHLIRVSNDPDALRLVL